MGLVLRASKFGVLMWKMQVCRSLGGDAFICQPADLASDGQPWTFRVIEKDFQEWRALRPSVVPPHDLQRHTSERCGAGMLVQPRSGHILLVAAAKVGFLNLLVQHLKELTGVLQMTFPARGRPNTEVPLLTALIREVLKDTTNEELKNILNERGREPAGDYHAEGATCLLELGNIELFSGLTRGTDLEDEARAFK